MAVIKNENLEMDLQNLISCIECHKEEENTDVIIETLKTIINICTEEEIGKDAFREVGGLDFLMQFIMDTDQVLILESGLKTLAFVIDENVHSQMHMTQDKVFRILLAIIQKDSYPLSVLKNALVLFSTLLFQNRGAQDMIQENESLLSLMNLYKCFAPINAYYHSSQEDSEKLGIWLAINSALCFAVNNPLHEKNQLISSALFPLSIRIIETTSNPITIKATSSFLSLSIANNERNQNSFAELDGLLTLNHSLNKNFEEIQLCIKECNNVIKKGNLETLNCLISVVSAAVSDHEKNASLCGKLGIVSLMTKLLFIITSNTSAIKKILLVLGHCVDAYSENRFIILQAPKLDILLKRNLETDDTELQTAARYLLQLCLNDIIEENQQMDDFCLYDGNNSLELSQHKCKVHGESGSDILKQNFSDICNPFSVQRDIPKLNAELNLTNFKTKCDQNVMDKNQHSCKCTENSFEKDSCNESQSDSLGEISLQSAGHLFRLRQMKMKGTGQNKEQSSPKKENFKDYCSVKEVCHLNTDLDINNFGIQDLKIDCLMKKQKTLNDALKKSHCNSKKLSYSKQKMSAFKNKKGMKTTGKKINHLNSARSSDMRASGESGSNSRPEIRSKENEKLSNEKVLPAKEVIHVVSVDPDQNSSATTSKRKLSNKPFSFSLQSFHDPYSYKNVNSLESTAGSSNQLHPSKPAGCMEVVVLPGAVCPQHKLAAQFELLKVCPLQTGK